MAHLMKRIGAGKGITGKSPFQEAIPANRFIRIAKSPDGHLERPTIVFTQPGSGTDLGEARSVTNQVVFYGCVPLVIGGRCGAHDCCASAFTQLVPKPKSVIVPGAQCSGRSTHRRQHLRHSYSATRVTRPGQFRPGRVKRLLACSCTNPGSVRWSRTGRRAASSDPRISVRTGRCGAAHR